MLREGAHFGPMPTPALISENLRNSELHISRECEVPTLLLARTCALSDTVSRRRKPLVCHDPPLYPARPNAIAAQMPPKPPPTIAIMVSDLDAHILQESDDLRAGWVRLKR
jgi:hypothetical protein